jgi:hypothetical protein
MTRTHYKTLLENAYLGQWDLVDEQGRSREVTVTIEKVERYQPEMQRQKRMPDGSYRPQLNNKLKISFKGKKKPWLSGPVTQDTIKGMYGPYIEDWVGKRLTLYVDVEVMMGRTKVGGIRVKPTIPTGKDSAAALDRPVDTGARERMDEAAEAAIGPVAR